MKNWVTQLDFGMIKTNHHYWQELVANDRCDDIVVTKTILLVSKLFNRRARKEEMTEIIMQRYNTNMPMIVWRGPEDKFEYVKYLELTLRVWCACDAEIKTGV